jgi:hypothetical protein
MTTQAETMEHLKGYEGQHVCSIIWCREDVLGTAKDMGISITTEQADEVLDLMESHHDASLGISWENIRCELQDLVESGEATQDKNAQDEE